MLPGLSSEYNPPQHQFLSGVEKKTPTREDTETTDNDALLRGLRVLSAGVRTRERRSLPGPYAVSGPSPTAWGRQESSVDIVI